MNKTKLRPKSKLHKRYLKDIEIHNYLVKVLSELNIYLLS